MEPQQEFDIKKYLNLFYQKRYIYVVIVVIVTSIAIALSYVLPKTYEAKSTVLIERNFMNELIKGLTVTPLIDDRVKAVEAILKSRALILKVMGDLDLELTRKSDVEVEKLVQAFQKATDIKYGVEMNRSATSDMDMFTVSFKNSNPVIARDYVNILVRRYIEESLSHNRDEAYGANKFLLEQIDLFKNKISSIEGDIARMRRQPTTVSHDGLRVLQKRLDELHLQYTDNHPEVMKLKAEIEALKNQSTGGKPSADAVKLAALERDRETYQKIYQDLMATLGRSEVSSHIEVQDKGGTFKILEPAILPIRPASPSRAKIILLGLFAGIGGGIGLIILLDSLDKSVRSVDTLKDFGLPVLAVIPHMQNPADMRKKKRNDLVLYLATGIYLVCVAGLLSFEIFNGGAK